MVLFSSIKRYEDKAFPFCDTALARQHFGNILFFQRLTVNRKWLAGVLDHTGPSNDVVLKDCLIGKSCWKYCILQVATRPPNLQCSDHTTSAAAGLTIPFLKTVPAFEGDTVSADKSTDRLAIGMVCLPK